MKMRTLFIFLTLCISLNGKIDAQIVSIYSDTVNIGDSIIVRLKEQHDNIGWQKSNDNINWMSIENETNDSLLYVINETIYIRALVGIGTCDSIISGIAEFILNPKYVLKKPANFLFNIPIIEDTIYSDSDYGIDMRVAIAGYIIDSVQISINDYLAYKGVSTIIDLASLWIPDGISKIDFLIKAYDTVTNEYVSFTSHQLYINKIENLSNRYILASEVNGRLNMNWPKLDKEFTNYYLVEKFLGDNNKYKMSFITTDSVFIDSSYVGEEAVYRISVINRDNIKQKIWQFRKENELPNIILFQASDSGYYLNFNKCPYYNNFEKYYLTTGMNYNPDSLYSSDLVDDTVYYAADAKFADEERYWLRILPKIYPQNFSMDDDWMIYGHFLYKRFGIKSFSYDGIVALNDSMVVYTLDGNIYKRNLISDLITDSIVNENARYGYLRTTPAGKYIYVLDENIYGSTAYFWSFDAFSSIPDYEFEIDFIVPPVSDNLIAIKSVPSNVVPSKLALYNVKNGNRTFTTDYDDNSNRPKISSNGKYFFIDDSALKLCSYENNIFNLIWQESDWTKYYRFYDFSSQNNDKCYIWDDNKKFSIRSTLDFSVLTSFTLELEEIINIDYYNKKIMGYVTGKVLLYNLEDGTLEKEIPANLSELFFYNNKSIRVGNFLYNNHGVKYEIK